MYNYVCVCVYVCIYIYIYIYRQHFFIDTYLIEPYRHFFLYTYFLLILSNFRIDLMILGWNWLINLP